jgi:hypothetical protein
MAGNVAPIVASNTRKRTQHLLRQQIESCRSDAVGVVGAGSNSSRFGCIWLGMIELKICNNGDGLLRRGTPDDAQTGKVERQKSKSALKIVWVMSVVDCLFAFAMSLGVFTSLLSACLGETHHQGELVLLKLN